MKKSILKIIILLVIATINSCNSDDDTTKTKNTTSIELISGDNQSANPGAQLSDQIVLKITNESGEPFVGFPIDLVHIEVSQGAAFFASPSANAEGHLFINWTLGDSSSTQTLTISATFSGNELENSPITVTAFLIP